MIVKTLAPPAGPYRFTHVANGYVVEEKDNPPKFYETLEDARTHLWKAFMRDAQDAFDELVKLPETL